MVEEKESKLSHAIEVFGRGAATFTNTFLQAGRETVNTIIDTILPFMFFVSVIVGIVNGSGIGTWLANILAPLASNIVGLIILGLICSIPVLSPVLGPGAVIAQVIGTLVGTLIANGAIPVEYSLAALFAVDTQVGCDFLPVAAGLGEAEPENIECGVPAQLLTQFITSPLGIILGYFVGLMLF